MATLSSNMHQALLKGVVLVLVVQYQNNSTALLKGEVEGRLARILRDLICKIVLVVGISADPIASVAQLANLRVLLDHSNKSVDRLLPCVRHEP